MERQQPAHAVNENFLTSRGGIVMIGFLALVFVLMFTEHRAHVLGALPFLILLSCPLMHLFMHHGHGHHQERPQQPGDDRPSSEGQSQ